MAGKYIDTSGLPPWSMDNHGLITTSALANAKSLIYTFIETALIHNDQILDELAEEVVIETPALEPNPDTEEEDMEVTKADLNKILVGMYTPRGVKRWWSRPRKALDGRTPDEMWEEDCARVVKLIKGFSSEGT